MKHREIAVSNLATLLIESKTEEELINNLNDAIVNHGSEVIAGALGTLLTQNRSLLGFAEYMHGYVTKLAQSLNVPFVPHDFEVWDATKDCNTREEANGIIAAIRTRRVAEGVQQIQEVKAKIQLL
jgi:hypothetical protein